MHDTFEACSGHGRTRIFLAGRPGSGIGIALDPERPVGTDPAPDRVRRLRAH